MIAVLVRNTSHGPIRIPTRLADTEVQQPCAGDLVTVQSTDGKVEYSIRLKAPAGPQCWHGVIFAIDGEGESVAVAYMVELDDVVEIFESEMTSIIRCQQVG